MINFNIKPEMIGVSSNEMLTYKDTWREANRIPEEELPLNWVGSSIMVDNKTVNITTSGVVAYYEKLPVYKIPGRNAYQSEYFKNIIPPEYTLNRMYKINLYDSSLNELPFDIGNPTIDNRNGVIYFNREFSNNIQEESLLYFSFYRYVGVIGFYGSVEEEQFPLIDTLPLIKDADDYNNKARFIIEGHKSDGDNYYFLPDTENISTEKTNERLITEKTLIPTLKNYKVDGGVFM